MAVGRHWTKIPLKQSQATKEGGLEIYMEGQELCQGYEVG